MKVEQKYKYAKLKIWLGFIALFICGSMVGVGIANWGHSVKDNRAQNNVMEQNIEKSCQAIENVLLGRLWGDDSNCDSVNENLATIMKLIDYGCPENRDKFIQMANNKQAVLDVACVGYVSGDARIAPEAKSCEQIEANLKLKLGGNYVDMDAEGRIERAKIYSVMAEKGCPENSAKYVDAAKKELEIARGISDDKFNENETIEVVETYKRLKMQQDAEEIFNKAKKLTNPAIDFIMQVEKIINE